MEKTKMQGKIIWLVLISVLFILQVIRDWQQIYGFSCVWYLSYKWRYQHVVEGTLDHTWPNRRIMSLTSSW